MPHLHQNEGDQAKSQTTPRSKRILGGSVNAKLEAIHSLASEAIGYWNQARHAASRGDVAEVSLNVRRADAALRRLRARRKEK